MWFATCYHQLLAHNNFIFSWQQSFGWNLSKIVPKYTWGDVIWVMRKVSQEGWNREYIPSLRDFSIQTFHVSCVTITSVLWLFGSTRVLVLDPNWIVRQKQSLWPSSHNPFLWKHIEPPPNDAKMLDVLITLLSLPLSSLIAGKLGWAHHLYVN